MIKGLVVSCVMLVVIAGLIYAFAGEELMTVPLLFLSLPFPVGGLILGHAGTRLRGRRFFKLFVLGLGLVYVSALTIAMVLILGDRSGYITGWQIPWSIFFLGSVGFLFYAALAIPVLLAGVFAIERWTRSPAAPLAPTST